MKKTSLAILLIATMLLSLASCGNSGIKTYDNSAGFTVTVDQNGLATWNAVEGAVGYEYCFVYDSVTDAHYTTTENSVQIPEGYCLHIRPVFGEDEYGDWCATDTYGDPNARLPLNTDAIVNDTPAVDYPPVVDPPVDFSEITISVDQNGVATWDAVPGTVRYYYQLSYLEGALKNAVIDRATVLDTRLTIPEGYMLDVDACDAQDNVIAHGSTEIYGDPAARGRLPYAGPDSNIDIRWEDLLYYDLVKNIKRDTVKALSDGSLYFEAVGPKNDTLRFVGNGISIAADGGITMSPSADLVCLDAIGCIYSYEFTFSEYGQAHNTAININAAYTFDPDLLHVNSPDQLASIGTFGSSVVKENTNYNGLVSLSVSKFQPNFIAVSSSAYGEDDFTLSELTVFYDESTYATGIDAVSFYTDFYTAYLEGEHYDPTRERFSVKEGILNFYLIAFPDTQHIIDQQLRFDAPETHNGALFGIDENLYKIGALKDASGKQVDKNTYAITSGSTIQVSIGDRQFDVELPVVSKHTDAQNMHDLVPCSYPEAVGTINSIVIPLAWADQPHTATAAIREDFLAEMGRIIDKDGNVIADYSDALAATTGRFSLSKYFDVASYGKLTLQAFVTDWFPTGLNFADVRNSNASDELLEQIRQWLFSTYPDMDWTRFDKDANGYFDSVIMLNAGDMGSDDSFAIPSFSGGVRFGLTYTGDRAGTPQKPDFSSYILSHQHMFDDNVIIHEFGHTLGLIDYYDVSYSGIDAVGKFDMQSASVGDWNAYSKYAVGWTAPTVVKDLAPGQSVELTIGSLATTGDTIVIPGANSKWYGNPFSEYIMIDLLDTNADINKVSAADYEIENALGVRISHVNATMEHRDLEADGKTYPIGTIHIANNYKANGKYNLEVIQAGGDNTFTDPDNLRTILSTDDLFGAGDVFTVSKYAEFFTDGKLDDGTDLGYEITVVSVSGGSTPSATIRITRK